jgi:CheY-like chemotaxis protein
VKILIVEDYQSYAKILADVMSRAGMTVRVVHNLEEAMIEAVHLQPDIVLLDLNLPGSNSDQTLKRIPELQEKAPDAKIVAMSGYPADLLKEEAAKYGAGFTHKLDMTSEKKVLRMLLETIRNSRNSMEENMKLIQTALGESIGPEST